MEKWQRARKQFYCFQRVNGLNRNFPLWDNMARILLSYLLLSSHPESRRLGGCWNKLFPIRELTILRKVKEIKELCGDVLEYVAQAIAQIDAEISQKGRFRMETT